MWKAIPEIECKQVWDKFYKDFDFKPSIYKKDWPSIRTEKHNYKFSISNLLNNRSNELTSNDFLQKAIDTFIEITTVNEEIYVLDWVHECYNVIPSQLKIDNFKNFNNSCISFIPNGDYYIFLTKDLSNIWFGHPWEETVTIIGTELINAFNRNKPLFLINQNIKLPTTKYWH